MKQFQKYASLGSILLMFFIDFIGVGLCTPCFCRCFFVPIKTETDQALARVIAIVD
ncbi:MAG: hypothetical protein WCT20_03680 [Candidatus Babeliales bacterium]